MRSLEPRGEGQQLPDDRGEASSSSRPLHCLPLASDEKARDVTWSMRLCTRLKRNACGVAVSTCIARSSMLFGCFPWSAEGWTLKDRGGKDGIRLSLCLCP